MCGSSLTTDPEVRYTRVMLMTANTIRLMAEAASGHDCGSWSTIAPKTKDTTMATPHQMPVAIATLFNKWIAKNELDRDKTKSAPLSSPQVVNSCSVTHER